jgi:phenylpropionate dioxygenase-like ring-hydroxylating dioxygenase large terminal subunit
MNELKHWQVILKSSELQNDPLRVTLNNKEIVLFRSNNKIAGYFDECPHRRMKLSKGKVHNGRLVCPYHSWSYGTDGSCIKPSGGEGNFSEILFECREHLGLIWIKLANSTADFPILEREGYNFISTTSSLISAPLELVLDNFTEVEHTSSVHALLGYEIKDLSDVEVKLETSETSVRLYNKGKQKGLPFFLENFLGIEKQDFFIDDWTTYFSPVYTVYDQYWIDPKTNKERNNKLKVYVFFTPIDDYSTKIYAITYLKYNIFENFGLNLFLAPALSLFTDLEIYLDTNILKSLASHEVSLKGCKLTKFDKALNQNRIKLNKIYRNKVSDEIQLSTS